MSDVELVVSDDPAADLARRLAEAAGSGATIALSGGSGPRGAYEQAATAAPDWSRSELWVVDERCVPPDDDRSNFRLLREAILDRLDRPPRAVHRIEGELPPDEAAARYDAALDGVRFDLAVMGIGPDGHTASLFPNAPQLDERERRAIAAEAGMEPFVPRVTTTIPLLAETGLMAYLVTGGGKAAAVRRAFAGPPSRDTPASLVRGRSTLALLDRDAAARM